MLRSPTHGTYELQQSEPLQYGFERKPQISHLRMLVAVVEVEVVVVEAEVLEQDSTSLDSLNRRQSEDGIRRRLKAPHFIRYFLENPANFSSTTLTLPHQKHFLTPYLPQPILQLANSPLDY